MRYSLITLFLLLYLQPAQAQVWIDNGATWHYQFWAPHTEGHIVLNYDRDTLIDGIDCQIIEGEQHLFLMDETGALVNEQINHYDTHITYSSNDSVYYRVGESFFLLFDFGAEIGDSWAISDQPNPDFLACNEISKVVVTAIGTVDIAGESYRYIDLEPTANSPIGLKGRYIERFGQTSAGLERFRYLFPTFFECEGIPDDVPTEFPYFSFRCFEDDSFPLYNPSGSVCAEVLEITTIEKSTYFSMYPNPATDFFHINASLRIDKVEIYSFTGKLLSTIKASTDSAQINVADLPAGIYLVNIQFSNGIIERSNIAVE